MNNCEVLTKTGKIRGKQEDGVLKWLGIPYAKKPLGELRFRQAEPPEPWNGVLETVQFQKKEIQPVFFIQNPAIEESEDCLYLNVWSSGTKEKKPVLLWIYGSAFIMGEASLGMYDGTRFAKDDIVFVSFNYRVGVFGGYDLAHIPESKGEFDENILLSDQIQALRWVQDNIEAFGGNPDDVTIVGESAGGTAIFNLFASPAVDGLFHKGICQSGVIGATVRPEVGNINIRWLLRHLNVDEKDLGQIKNMDPRELSDASLWLISYFTRTYPGLYIAGEMTGELLPELPLEALKKGCGKDVKLLIGTNKDETSLFIHGGTSNMSYRKDEVERFFDNCNTPFEVRGKIEKYYSKYNTEKAIKCFMKDINFTYHSSLAADIQCQFADTYMYEFTYATMLAKMAGYGTFHCSEVPFAFDTTDKFELKKLYSLTSKKTIQYFTDVFHTAWVNFIKYGNPNGTGNEPWPKYELATKKVYQIDKKCRVLEDPYHEMKEVISGLKFY